MKLVAALFLTLGCAPIGYQLPSTALRYAETTSDEEKVRVTLRPITEPSWRSTAATRLRWNESPLYWPFRLRRQDRDLEVPLVPLPSLEVTIENQGTEPLRFSDVQIVIEDSSGHAYSLAGDARQMVPRVLDRLLAEVPELWILRQTWGPTDLWPELPPIRGIYEPIGLLIDQVKQVSLFGARVEVPPGGRFVGAMVFKSDGASTPSELAERLRGELRIRWSGVRMGARFLPPRSFTLPLESRAQSVVCSDGARVNTPDACPRVDGYEKWNGEGPCLQVGRSIVNDRVVLAEHWIGGTRVTRAGERKALLDVPDSRRAASRAGALRLAGTLLLGAGAFSAAGAAAGIAGTGDLRDSPAGLSLLAVSGVGVLLHYLGARREAEAERSFNRYAFQTGACAPPL